jgi:hypothetical protein
VFVACFVATLTVLLLENLWLFDERITEDGDFAANSIIIEDARHFDLLVGNYSRQRFSHPGPAYFYVQAAGEALFTDLLGVTPAPFNGHNLAILTLNGALIALTVMTVWRHLRSLWVVVAATIALLAWASAHDGALASTWMPHVYIAPFLLLCVAAASVAAGETASLWCLALAAGLLVHGHVEFLFFVPLVSVPALVGLLRSRPPVARLLRATARHWWSAAGVLMLFAAPLALNLALHYPGEFDDYIDYARSDPAGGHSFRAATDFVVGYWSSDAAGGQLLAGVLVAAAVAVALVHPRPQARRFGAAALAVVALVTVLFVFYAMYGIDLLDETYVGYFYWAAPMTVALVLLGMLLDPVRPTALQRGALLALGATVVVASVRGSGLRNPYRGAPELAKHARSLAAARVAADQPVVLAIAASTWPDAVGLMVESHRRGVRTCMADDAWEFIVTHRFVCRAAERRGGLRVHLASATSAGGELGVPSGGNVVWRTPLSVATIERAEPAKPGLARG